MAAESVGAIGTALKVGGSISAGNAKANAANFNAYENIENANEALRQSADQEKMQRASSAQFIGNQQANYGASGVSSATGSAIDVLKQSATNAEMDALKIKHAGDMKAWAYKSGAALDVSDAANAHIAANYGAASAIFSGASSMMAAGAD